MLETDRRQRVERPLRVVSRAALGSILSEEDILGGAGASRPSGQQLLKTSEHERQGEPGGHMGCHGKGVRHSPHRPTGSSAWAHPPGSPLPFAQNFPESHPGGQGLWEVLRWTWRLLWARSARL